MTRLGEDYEEALGQASGPVLVEAEGQEALAKFSESALADLWAQRLPALVFHKDSAATPDKKDGVSFRLVGQAARLEVVLDLIFGVVATAVT